MYFISQDILDDKIVHLITSITNYKIKRHILGKFFKRVKIHDL